MKELETAKLELQGRRIQDIAKGAQSLEQAASGSLDRLIASGPAGLAYLVSMFRNDILDGINLFRTTMMLANGPPDIRLPAPFDPADWGWGAENWIRNATGPQLLACFPDLAVAIRAAEQKQKVAQEAAAAERKVAQEVAEKKRQLAQEAAAAERKVAQEAREVAAARAKLPINILSTAYTSYVDVKRCQEAREGYATIYISNPEMDQAREAVRQIEQTMRSKLDQNTTTDDVWSRVATTEGRNFHPSGDYQEGTRMLCRERLALLLGILREQAPERGIIEKDF